jgi:hypothetical protein
MSLQIGNFDSYIESNKIKPEMEGKFRKALFELEEKVSSLSNSVEVVDIKSTLGELQGKILEEGGKFKELIDRVISTASNHIIELSNSYYEKRNETLEGIPDRVISLEGVSLNGLENSLLRLVLENEGEARISEYSLKELCSNMHDLSNEQLPESIDIVEKIIESLKDESKVPDLIEFCSKNISRVQTLFSIIDYLGLDDFQNAHLPGSIEIVGKLISSLKDESKIPELITFCSESYSKTQSLFSIIDYLGLDDFQNAHLEPFNKVFPGVPLDQVPTRVFHLDATKQDVRNIDFSKFKFLKNLNLTQAKGFALESYRPNSDWRDNRGFAAKELSKLFDKTSMKTLNLSHISVSNVDFSGFTRLETLNLNAAKNLTAKSFNTISAKASIETLDLSSSNVRDFDFSGFTGLKTLNLNNVKDLTAEQFNAISPEARASIQTLDFTNDVDIRDFNFSGFTNLKTLNLGNARALIAEQFNAISPEAKTSIETLNLRDVDVAGFDFSGFTNLKSLNLEEARGLTAEQFNKIPVTAKASIESLDLSYVNVTGFDFSGFTGLKILNLDNVKGLTAMQFNTIPVTAKASIESLDLSYVNVTGFDFSGFTGLKILNLDNVKGLTAMQFNTISPEAKASIESLDLIGIDVRGFNFSGFTNFETLNLGVSIGLSATQFNAISGESKASIKTLQLAYINVSDFDFSGFTGLKDLGLNKVKALTAAQLSRIPNKASIEKISLSEINVDGFDFSEFTGKIVRF